MRRVVMVGLVVGVVFLVLCSQDSQGGPGGSKPSRLPGAGPSVGRPGGGSAIFGDPLGALGDPSALGAMVRDPFGALGSVAGLKVGPRGLSPSWVGPGALDRPPVGRTSSAVRTAAHKQTRSVPVYHIIDLGTLGGPASEAYGINASGQVVGAAMTADGHWHAFLWSPAWYDDMHDLGTLGGPYSYAYGINASGQVVGCALTSGGKYRAFLWKPRVGPMQDLGTLGDTIHVANAINDSGQVVGSYGEKIFEPVRSFFWDPPSGPMEDMGMPSQSEAYGISASGGVVGVAEVSGPWHAFLWPLPAGPMWDLHGPPGGLGGSLSEARGINASGSSVVGWAQTPSGNPHAFCCGPPFPLQMSDLGTLGGFSSGAYGINAWEQVVGDAYTAAGARHAFLSKATGPMQDLNDLLDASSSGWILQTATAINDARQIVGSGLPPESTSRHAFLATPLPDLVVESLTVTPDRSTLGTRLTYSVTETNNGTGLAGAHKLALWEHRASAPGLPATGEYNWDIAALAAGASETRTDQDTPPSTGTRLAWAAADAQQAVAESDEGNNTKSYAYLITPAPDLVVSALTVSPNPAPLGTEVTLSVTEQNAGGAAAGAHRLSAWGNRATAPTVGTNGDSNWDLPVWRRGRV